MINVFCTVGSEKYQFDRLMRWIETLALEFPDHMFFVQFGSCTYIPKGKNIQSVKFLSEQEFIKHFHKADVLVGHCGEGTILQAVEAKKPYILIPRQSAVSEHVDDHQFELARLLKRNGAGIAFTLDELRDEIRNPKFVAFIIDQANTIRLLEQLLSTRHTNKKALSYDSKILLICSGGGHYNSMKLIENFYQKFKQRIWVTFKIKNIELELKNENVIWAYHPTIRNIPNFFRNLVLAMRTMPKISPDLIITTGAGLSVPFLIVAKLFCKAEIVFIELATRVEKLSMSAKILHKLRIVDLCLVRHENLKNIYKANSKIVLIEN